MNQFQVIAPSALLAPYVKQYWFVRIANVAQSIQRLVPFGCVTLSFHRGDSAYSSLDGKYMPLSHLHGMAIDYTDLVFSGCVDFVSVVFQPAGAQVFFGMPVSELSHSYVSLDMLGDSKLRELERKLHDREDNEACVHTIEQFLLRRLYHFDNYENKQVYSVMHAIHSGETDVNRLAETACLGYKQFKRVFTGHTGVNPKDFLRIVRFQKVHHLLQQHAGMTISQLACECGYYDKSHLVKELREFSGFTPIELLRACDPVYSDYHALFRSAFVDVSLS